MSSEQEKRTNNKSVNQSFLEWLLPCETDYTVLKQWRRRGTLCFIGISCCSLSLPFLQFHWPNHWITLIFNGSNVVLMIVYYCLTLISETFLYPATATKRRKGLLDNSLGLKLLEEPVIGYYSNDNIPHGIFKVFVNCWENCFFTLSIAKKMRPAIILKNLVIILLLGCVSYYGFKDNLIAVPLLQLFLSSIFLTELVHHFYFISKLKALFEKAKEIADRGKNSSSLEGDTLLMLLDYETTLAYNKAPSSDRVYHKFNEQFSLQWEEIKKRYGVTG